MKTISLQANPELELAWRQLGDSIVTFYFEKARVEYLESLAKTIAMRSSSWVQASLHLDYLGSYLGNCDSTVDMSVTKVGNTSFTLSFRLYQQGDLRVTGNCVLVNIDHSSNRPAQLSSLQRQVLDREVLSFYRMQDASHKAVGQAHND